MRSFVVPFLVFSLAVFSTDVLSDVTEVSGSNPEVEVLSAETTSPEQLIASNEGIPFKNEQEFNAAYSEVVVRLGAFLLVLMALAYAVIQMRKRGLIKRGFLNGVSNSEVASMTLLGRRRLGGDLHSYLLEVDGERVLIVDNGSAIDVLSMNKDSLNNTDV
jgi:hypothetical protein